jgi:NDP-sugar pyrophosphorylase family protein
MQVVIAAGGFGTRLRSITGHCPKVLAAIGSRPFLSLVIDRWRARGATSVHLLLGYQADEIVEAIARHAEDGPLSWSIENLPRGVAGALADADQFLDDRFALTYGDIYPIEETPLDDIAADTGRTMLVVSHHHTVEPLNVSIRNDVVVGYGRTADATALDAGMLVLERGDLKLIDTAAERVDERDFIPHLIERGVRARLQDRATIHIGDPAAYRAAQRALGFIIQDRTTANLNHGGPPRNPGSVPIERFS